LRRRGGGLSRCGTAPAFAHVLARSRPLPLVHDELHDYYVSFRL